MATKTARWTSSRLWPAPQYASKRTASSSGFPAPAGSVQEIAHQSLQQESREYFAALSPDLDKGMALQHEFRRHMSMQPTLVSYWRIVWTMALTVRVLRLDIAGDIIETGVYTGGTTISMLYVMQQHERAFSKRLWACDSFRGTPAAESQDRDCTRLLDDGAKGAAGARSCNKGAAGWFQAKRSTFASNLRKFNVSNNHHRLHIVEGWYNETLPPKGLKKISLLRLDGDMYTSTRDALKALYPLVVEGGLVYVDDYGSFAGCSRAVDEFLRSQPGGRPQLHRIVEPSPPNASTPWFFEAIWWVKPKQGGGATTDGGAAGRLVAGAARGGGQMKNPHVDLNAKAAARLEFDQI